MNVSEPEGNHLHFTFARLPHCRVNQSEEVEEENGGESTNQRKCRRRVDQSEVVEAPLPAKKKKRGKKMDGRRAGGIAHREASEAEGRRGAAIGGRVTPIQIQVLWYKHYNNLSSLISPPVYVSL